MALPLDKLTAIYDDIKNNPENRTMQVRYGSLFLNEDGRTPTLQTFSADLIYKCEYGILVSGTLTPLQLDLWSLVKHLESSPNIKLIVDGEITSLLRNMYNKLLKAVNTDPINSKHTSYTGIHWTKPLAFKSDKLWDPRDFKYEFKEPKPEEHIVPVMNLKTIKTFNDQLLDSISAAEKQARMIEQFNKLDIGKYMTDDTSDDIVWCISWIVKLGQVIVHANKYSNFYSRYATQIKKHSLMTLGLSGTNPVILN